MKATGIVRRIDDLGRVVIPKEIRQARNIAEGDPLEIWVDDDGSIVLKRAEEQDTKEVLRKNLQKALDNLDTLDTGYIEDNMLYNIIESYLLETK